MLLNYLGLNERIKTTIDSISAGVSSRRTGDGFAKPCITVPRRPAADDADKKGVGDTGQKDFVAQSRTVRTLARLAVTA